MERIQDLIPLSLAVGCNGKLTHTEKLQLQCDADNAVIGELKAFDCPECRNKGIIYFVQDNEIMTRDCECMERRLFIDKLKASGLERLARLKTFKNFEVKTQIQYEMRRAAYDYAKADTDDWLYIGGQCGSGKTHLCVAVATKLLKTKRVRYFVWEEGAGEILAKSGNDDAAERRKIVEAIKNAEVLYIDDFLRREKPTDAERKLAFEILNARYNRNLRTIITSEKTLDELYKIDRGIAGRISEMCGDYKFSVDHDPQKDYRIYGSKA